MSLGLSGALVALAGCESTIVGEDRKEPNVGSADVGGKNLGFERSDAAGRPSDWEISKPGIAVDPDTRRSGTSSVRIAEPALVSQCFDPTAHRGKQLEFSGYLKTEARADFVADIQISSYVDREVSRTVALTRVTFEGPDAKNDTGSGEAITESLDWTRKSVAVEVHPDSVEVCISVIARGNGTLWADDLALVAR